MKTLTTHSSTFATLTGLAFARRLVQALGLAMKATVALLLLITLPLCAAEQNEAHTGKVLEVSKDRIELDEGGRTIAIGFVASTDASLSLKKIKLGDEVRAIFGATLSSNGDSINELLSIQVCEMQDTECAADRKRQVEEQKEEAERQAALEREHERCRQAMEASLAEDPRYVPDTRSSASEEALTRYRALPVEKRSCVADVLKQHENAVFEACELHHCGDRVGGGCSHIAGYSMTTAAIEKATDQCRK